MPTALEERYRRAEMRGMILTTMMDNKRLYKEYWALPEEERAKICSTCWGRGIVQRAGFTKTHMHFGGGRCDADGCVMGRMDL